jgi:hypothetical protein
MSGIYGYEGDKQNILQPFQINQGLITEEEFYEWLKKLKNSKLK